MIAAAAAAAVCLSFFLGAMATNLAQRVAFRTNYLDVPQRHKGHARPTPLLGGSAIFAAILGPSLLALALARIWTVTGPPDWLAGWFPQLVGYVPRLAERAPAAVGILAAATGLHIVGLIDDRRALGPWIKLAAQLVAAAVVVVWFDVRILTLAGSGWSITLSILWLVVITNAFNFLDNMDGLSAGVAAIVAAAMLSAAAGIGQLFVTGWLCVVLGAILGFLPYNFAPAKIFMGDAGSLVVGFLLGVLSCLTTYVSPELSAQSPRYFYSVLAPLVLMAVPIYDTMSVMLLRIREKRNPMIGDRRHFSHRLLKRGMSVRTAVLTIYLCTLATAIAATLLTHVDAVGAVLVFGQTVTVLGIIALLESSGPKA